MTKNQHQKQPPNSRLKKGKIKRKQMFNQLQTINEQKINKIKNQMDEQFNPQLQPQNMQQQSYEFNTAERPQKLKQQSIEDVCEAVNKLMAKNKVGIKNAFDVPIIDLLDVISYNKDETQNSWKTLSSTLQNDYKIYGYRVDAIHSITYSILNIMSRRQAPAQNQLNQQSINNKSSLNLQNTSFLDLKQGFLDDIDNNKTFLQKDHKNINIASVDSCLTSDPILQRTKRLFDQPGLKGMLTNNINIDNNLQLPLYSNKHNKNHQLNQSSQQSSSLPLYSLKLSQVSKPQINIIEYPLKIFESTQKIKIQLSKIINLSQQSQYCTNKQLQKIWNNVKDKNIKLYDNENNNNTKVYLDMDQSQNNLGFMIDQNSDNHMIVDQNNINAMNNGIKYINQYIKIKNKNKNINNEKDILQGTWLSDIDKKFLGIKTSASGRNITQQLNNKKQLDDFILFDLVLQQKDEILRKQSPTKDINEQIQDRFLTTIRPMNQFKIQKILTLREQPQLILYDPIVQQQPQIYNQHFLQKQIDIKRQSTSIKQMKSSITEEIFSQKSKSSTFNQTYTSYCQKQGYISPALCFLTLLHLANENNLEFSTKDGEMDFFIKKQQVK